MRYLLSLLVASVVALVLGGCGAGQTDTPTPVPPLQQATSAPVPSPTDPTPASSTPLAAASPSEWVPPTSLPGTLLPGAEATLTAAPPLKMARLEITNQAGEKVGITVEIADTEQSRELGLMFRPSMPPDAGMLFDFGGQTTSGFWMQNTILPLSIAFIRQDGTIIDIKDMQPLDTTSVEGSGPYYYALETNQGFFRVHGIAPGGRMTLPGTQSVVIPGMPPCAGPSPAGAAAPLPCQ